MGILTKHPVMAKRCSRCPWCRVTLVSAMFVLLTVQESSAATGTVDYLGACVSGSTKAAEMCAPDKYMKCLSGRCMCEDKVSEFNTARCACKDTTEGIDDICMPKCTADSGCSGDTPKCVQTWSAANMVCSVGTGCGSGGTCKTGEKCSYKSATASVCKCGTAASCTAGQTCISGACEASATFITNNKTNSGPGMSSTAGSLILLTCAAALVLTAA